MRRSGVRADGAAAESGRQWSSFLPAMTFYARSWRPVVQFTAGHSRTPWNAGQDSAPVSVMSRDIGRLLLPASRPGVAMIDTFSQAWHIPASLVLIGIVVVAGAAR
jgi:hypothetical protein